MPKVDDIDAKMGELVFSARIEPLKSPKFPVRDALAELTEQEQIEATCNRYRFWVLNHAQELTAKPNAGPAILAILNSYFDMIAQFDGYLPDITKVKKKVKKSEHEKWKFVSNPELVKKGLEMVFYDENLKDTIIVMNGNHKNDEKVTIADAIVTYLRNPVAHMGMWSDHIILGDEYDKALVWGPFREGRDVIVINPSLWARRIIDHFNDYEANLRNPDPQYNNLRDKFLARMKIPV